MNLVNDIIILKLENQISPVPHMKTRLPTHSNKWKNYFYGTIYKLSEIWHHNKRIISDTMISYKSNKSLFSFF
jgi:hypothetical protein